MASFILRPNSDIYLQNGLMNSNGSSDTTPYYLFIDEETADANGTYISWGMTGDEEGVGTHHLRAEFGLGTSYQVGKITITGIKVYLNMRHDITESYTTTFTPELKINGSPVGSVNIPVSDNGGNYVMFGGNLPASCVNALNNNIKNSGYKSLPSMSLYITRTITVSEEVKSAIAEYTFVSQVYVEVLYEEIRGIDIHRKVNGAWVQAQAAYLKRNGAWVGITEDECKEILQGNFVTS